MAPNASDFETMKALQSITSNDVDGKPLGFKAVSFSAATIDSADGADDSTLFSDFDALKDALNSAAQGPAASIKAGHVPQPPSVGIIPSGDDPEVEQLYKHLVEMQSMISLYTAIQDVDKRKQRGRATPYGISIPAEAAIAAADSADSGFNALLHPLSGFLNISSQTSRTELFEMQRTSLHLDFLTKLFTGFSLNKTDLAACRVQTCSSY